LFLSCLPGAVRHRVGIVFFVLLFAVRPLPAYSVLSHEAIIDSAWGQSIQPLLLQRYPQSTSDEFVRAHAYAYGGCIVQDMGYYPFGSHFFSDLVHYVRSGDFVVNLLQSAENLNEYAFALGALAHYAADTQGHSLAVNPSVGMQYPKLERRFGKIVTYADKPSAHLQVEFGFDVLQVAHGSYAPQAYHDFIGFEVARPLLERAFRKTYSLELSDVFANVDLALSSYRHVVSSFIPTMTRAAWHIRKDELIKAQPGLTKRQFLYNVSRASYRKEWGRDYRQPPFAARALAFVVRILPKVGPLRTLNFHAPTPQTEQLFQTSFNRTLDVYRGFLAEELAAHLVLANRDFDTGELTRPTEYSLADNTYSQLVVELARQNSAAIDPQLRANVLEFYRDPGLSFATRKSPARWKATLEALDKLK
jgi:hypothetical protein